jgi:hypothetical protein
MKNKQDIEVKIIYNAIRCPDGTVLVSHSRHDFVMHMDKVSGEEYFLDGGLSYVRRSVNKVPAKSLVVTTEDSFLVQREVFQWGTYGVDGLSPRSYITLKDMAEDHISAILRTQTHLNGTYVQELFKQELSLRLKLGVL